MVPGSRPGSSTRDRFDRAPWTRRAVLRRVFSIGLTLPFLGGLVAMLRREQAANRPATVSIPPDVQIGLSVVDTVIVHRSEGGIIHAFSSRCTHLGCRIDRIVGDEVVCPCHGSRYRADGSVAAGPASRPLKPFRVEPDPGTGGWIARAS